MSTASGPSDYRSSSGELAAHTDGVMDEVSDRVNTLTSDVVRAIEERPYTSLAIAGGLAFAIGALWVVKRQQQQSSFERLRVHSYRHFPTLGIGYRGVGGLMPV